MRLSNIEWSIFKREFLSYLDNLAHFDFSAANPVLWIFFFILFFILLRFWKTKKAFSCSLVIVLILIASTKIERLMVNFFSKAGETFDPVLPRIAAVIIVLVVLLYYSIIKGNDD